MHESPAAFADWMPQCESSIATQREAEENQSGVQMRLPFEPSLDDREQKFYALPQPALPPKDDVHPPAQVYQGPQHDV